MSKVVEIIEGWANVMKDQFNAVEPGTKALSKARLLECNECEIRQGNSCSPLIYSYHVKTGARTSGCGCNIAAKTLSPSSSCPLGKW